MGTYLNFYVYILFRPWDGIPCYVGKGKRNRINVHRNLGARHYNRHLANIFKKANGDIPSVIVREGLSEQEAFEIEIALIKAIGRFPDGPLVNGTDGGDGTANKSPEAIARLSEFGKTRIGERNPFFGKKHSEATKQKLSISKIGKPGPLRGRTGDKHPWFGRKHTEGEKKKIGSGNIGKIMSQETRQKLREAAIKQFSDKEKLEKFSAVQRARTDIRNRAPNGKFVKCVST